MSPPPAVDGIGPEARVVQGLLEGQLLLQRCVFTEQFFFPPRLAGKGLRSQEWELVPASGLGTVYAATRVDLRGKADTAFCIGLVDLAEGPRLLARIAQPAADPLAAGTRVRMRLVPATWAPQIAHPVPFFDPDPQEDCSP